MKIKELSLTNFRRFEQLDLKLPDSNFIILIGENGCGKSSVLDAMGLLIEALVMRFNESFYHHRLQTIIKNDDVTNTKNKCEITLKIKAWNDYIEIKHDIILDEILANFYHPTPRGLFEEIREKIKNNNISKLSLIHI